MVNPLYKKGWFTSAPSAEAYLGDLKADGTVPLTADWNVGAFDLTAVDMTATNFKLSGTGTLTSTAGNATFTTSLTAATGNEAAFTLNYSVNKLTSGNDTGLIIDRTADTSSPGVSYLLDLRALGVSQMSVGSSGNVTATGYVSGSSLISNNFTGLDTNYGINVQNKSFSTDGKIGITANSGTWTQSSGTNIGMKLAPVLNMTGTAAYTDLQINRTETALGSGGQRLISAGTGGGTYVERFGVDNTGNEYMSTANGAYMKAGQISEELTLATDSATSTSATHLLPANSIIDCIVTRFTEAANNITNWSIGDGTDTDRFMTVSTTFTLGATTTNFNHILLGGANWYTTTDEHVVITTTTAGSWNTTGKIRITVFYRHFSPPTT